MFTNVNLRELVAHIHPSWNTINKLRVQPEEGERYLLEYLQQHLDDTFEIFFNPYLDGDRPDFIILKKGYGAVVIEVKDWNLYHYSVMGNNKWMVEKNEIRSPQQQAFRYKSNLFELHLPVLGIKELLNKNFFNVIDVFVYFHNASQTGLNTLYDNALAEIKEACLKINSERHNSSHTQYEKRMDYWGSRSRVINRDKSISLCQDTLDKKIQKIKQMRKHVLFTEDVYFDFKRRLLPPIHIQNQGVAINFDNKQLPLTESQTGFSKIKGVAGCGKTSILALRTLNARKRHNANVLILTYNITIRHYIKDTLSRITGQQLSNEIEVIHYHGFINSKINEHGIDIKTKMGQFLGSDQEKLEKVYASAGLFKDFDTEKYKTILIDEVQDYDPDWIKLIRSDFLDEDGEMVLFGDQSQNIYERENNQRESAIVQGFGTWNKLTKSYRSSIDTPLVAMFSVFQKKFLVEKYADSEVFENVPTQAGMNFDLLSSECSAGKHDLLGILSRIKDYIKLYNLHPNDVVILASKVEPLIQINKELVKTEKTKIMFESQEEVDGILSVDPQERRTIIEKIRRRKKTFFFQNSGLFKLSTIHSFKGLEAETAFFIVLEEDSPEVVYTAITRARKNLVVFDVEGSKFNEFFNSYITN